MAGKFEVYADKAGQYRWRLKASNGQVVASGDQAWTTEMITVVHAGHVRQRADLVTPDR